MQPRKPDDSLNLEDSGTLELGRLITGRQPDDQDADASTLKLPPKPRQGDTKSRELLANPFDVAEGEPAK